MRAWTCHTSRPRISVYVGKETTVDYNWLTPKAEARPAGDKGWGSYVTEPIQAGETVAVFGGWVVDESTLATMSLDRQHRSIQIDADLYLVSSDPDTMLSRMPGTLRKMCSA